MAAANDYIQLLCSVYGVKTAIYVCCCVSVARVDVNVAVIYLPGA